MIRRDFLLPFAWRVAAAGSALASGMIYLRLLRYLTPSSYGVVGAALQILNYLPLLDGGFRLTVNRLALAASSAAERKPILQFYQTLQLYITGLAFLGALLCMGIYWATPLAQHSGQTVGFFLSLAVVGGLTVGSGLQSGLLIGLGAQEQTYLVTTVNAWLNVAVLWVALRAGLDVWAFPLAMLATLLLSYMLAIGLIARRSPGLRFFCWRLNPAFWELFYRLRGGAWACFRSQVGIVLLYTIDLVFVAFLCGPVPFAIYAVLSRVFTMLRAFLQSASEVSWPVIAQRGIGGEGFRTVLVRSNAWLYGSVAGAACVTVIPFCRSWIAAAWVPTNPLVVYLLAARFVITGLATPATYALYGLGEFRALSRYVERELLAACVLGLLLGAFFQLAGVAAGFLLATSFGTLGPVVRAYAHKTGERTGIVLGQMWWRALAGLAYSGFWALCFLNYFPTGFRTTIPAIGGLASGLMLAVIISLLRMSKPAGWLQSPRALAQLLKSL